MNINKDANGILYTILIDKINLFILYFIIVSKIKGWTK